jgi:MoxR-like ATPase
MKQIERAADLILTELERAIHGKRQVLRLALTCLLAEGHLLLQDLPGTGKTMLCKALARVFGGSFKRIQGTPDLLPGDVTGSSVWNPEALASMPPEQAVRAAYGRFLDVLSAAGRPRAPQETPPQVLFRLPAELRKVARQAEVLTALFHQAAYTASGVGVEERTQAIGALRAMREALPPSISRRA